MPLLVSHLNVVNTCLRILRDRGFELEVIGEITDDLCYPTEATWVATKDGFIFRAYNPIELLGLVAVYDYVKPTEDKPYWWYVEGADIRSELLSAAFDKEIDEARKRRLTGGE
jgi:hypothetical protein